VVYLIVKRVDISGLDNFNLLRTVDYYGISGRENIWLRFEEHCKKRRFSSKTRGMLIFKKFTWENIDRSVFSTPEFAALAYEMELSKFRGVFNVGTIFVVLDRARVR
jgi:hypothetical protein